MNRSRLSRRIEKQSQKTFLLSILGIALIVFALIKFGMPLLINFSLLLAGKDTTDFKSQNSASFVPPPVLDPLFDATNSAEISISGKANKDETVKLYVNGELADNVKVKDDNGFEFKNVVLKDGENSIRTKAQKDNKEESDFSKETIVIYKKEPPILSVDSPTDRQSFSKDENLIIVSGKTDAGTKVTINDFWAIADDTGNFSYHLSLKEGENQIKIVATDIAGNKTQKEIKVNYSP